MTEEERNAGKTYRTYISNFVKHGSPEADGISFEPLQTSKKIMTVNGDFTFTFHTSENDLCDALDSIDYYNKT